MNGIAPEGAHTADADRDAYMAYANAAIALAAAVEVRDRLATDPLAPGERGPAAQAARERMLHDGLARFRAAQDAFLGQVTP